MFGEAEALSVESASLFGVRGIPGLKIETWGTPGRAEDTKGKCKNNRRSVFSGRQPVFIA
jgi:hypothetical protein